MVIYDDDSINGDADNDHDDADNDHVDDDKDHNVNFKDPNVFKVQRAVAKRRKVILSIGMCQVIQLGLYQLPFC